MTRLSRPDAHVHRSFLAAMREFADEGRAGDGTTIGDDLAVHARSWDAGEGFAAYLHGLLAESERPNRPGFVCCTTWWWVEDEEFVGRIALRHELTDGLREVGGHIGYDVRRSRRREGHATAMLAAVLPKAAGLGIDLALVTCDVDNEGSRRVIEANGGVLEDRRGDKLRYWVSTTR